jgi:hypothetical protein
MVEVSRGFVDRALRVILPDDCLVREYLLSRDHPSDEISRFSWVKLTGFGELRWRRNTWFTPFTLAEYATAFPSGDQTAMPTQFVLLAMRV